MSRPAPRRRLQQRLGNDQIHRTTTDLQNRLMARDGEHRHPWLLQLLLLRYVLVSGDAGLADELIAERTAPVQDMAPVAGTCH
jgi:hypothetical protein